MSLREIAIIAKSLDRMFIGVLEVGFDSSPALGIFWGSIDIWGNAEMSKIHTYFGFKNGKLVSVLQSVNDDVKEAINCTYYIAEPQEVEKQIEKWKEETAE